MYCQKLAGDAGPWVFSEADRGDFWRQIRGERFSSAAKPREAGGAD
jgi:hypothetical protein